MKYVITVLAMFAAILPAFGAAEQKVYGNDGTNITYVCSALSYSDSRRTAVAISGISKASAAVVTSAGHGFPTSARPLVTITGATGTGWVSGANTVNGTFTATITGVDTFTIPVDTQTNGTLAGTVVFTTTSPRMTVAEWKVQKYGISGTFTVWSGWQAGSDQYNQKCSDATSTSNNQQ